MKTTPGKSLDRLNELNKKCMDCQSHKKRNFKEIQAYDCMTCPIGMEIHSYDNPSWDVIDWSSGQFSKYYEN